MDWRILSTSFPRLIIRHQKKLGLKVSLAWYFIACVEYGTIDTSELAELTGLSISTIRDLKAQAKAAGWVDDHDGLNPFLMILSDLESQAIIAGTNSPMNLFFNSLGTWEQVMVLDQFSCRICNKKWTSECEVGFKVVKVAVGDTFHSSRVVLCKHCLDKAKESEWQKRFSLYLKHRDDRLKDRDNSYLSDFEDEIIRKIRDKKNENVNSFQAGAAEKEFIHNVVDTTKGSKRVEVAEVEPPPPLINPPYNNKCENVFVDNEKTSPANQKQVSDLQGEDGLCPPRVIPPKKRSKKSIKPENEEPVEEMTSSDTPEKPNKEKKERTAKKWSELIKQIETLEPEHWNTSHKLCYFEKEREKIYRFSGEHSRKESYPEKNQHITAIEDVLGCDIHEFIKFVPWIMQSWSKFWFGKDGFPTLRNVKTHLDDLIGEYRSSDVRENLAIKASGVCHVGVLEAPETIDITPEEMAAQEAKRLKIREEIDAL